MELTVNGSKKALSFFCRLNIFFQKNYLQNGILPYNFIFSIISGNLKQVNSLQAGRRHGALYFPGGTPIMRLKTVLK